MKNNQQLYRKNVEMKKSKIRKMWKQNRFVYWCPICKKNFLSSLIWLYAYCQRCLFGRKIEEEPEFFIN